MRNAVENLVERRNAEARIEGPTEHQPVKRAILCRNLGINRRTKAAIIVQTNGTSYFKCFKNWHENFGISRLNRAVFRGQRIVIVEGHVENVWRSRDGSWRTVEAICFAAIIHAKRDLNGTAGQIKQRSGNRTIELLHFIFTAVQRYAFGRNCIQSGKGRIRLRQRERVQDTAVQQANDTGTRCAGGCWCAWINAARYSSSHTGRSRCCCRGEGSTIMVASAQYRRRLAAGV